MAQNPFINFPEFYKRFKEGTKIAAIGVEKTISYICNEVLDDEYNLIQERMPAMIEWAEKNEVTIDQHNIRMWASMITTTYNFLTAGPHQSVYKKFWGTNGEAKDQFIGKGVRFFKKKRITRLSQVIDDTVETITLSLKNMKRLENHINQLTKENHTLRLKVHELEANVETALQLCENGEPETAKESSLMNLMGPCPKIATILSS